MRSRPQRVLIPPVSTFARYNEWSLDLSGSNDTVIGHFGGVPTRVRKHRRYCCPVSIRDKLTVQQEAECRLEVTNIAGARGRKIV